MTRRLVMLLTSIGLCGASQLLHANPPELPPLQICQVTGSQNELDFGAINNTQYRVARQGKLLPGEQTIQVTVLCSLPRAMVLSLAGSSTGQQFSWGEAGQLRVTLQNAELDGNPVQLAQSDARSARVLILQPGERFFPTQDNAPASGRQLSFTLSVTPEVDEQRLVLNRQQNWLSLLTLRLE